MESGNHSRGKHEDQDCHGIIALKSNKESSPSRYLEQGFCIQSSGPGPGCSESFDMEQSLTGLAKNGTESSATKPLIIGQGAVKQAVSLRWEGCKSPEVQDLSRAKSKCKDKDMRLNVASHDENDLVEVQGKCLMHKCCLTDKSIMSSMGVHLSPIGLAPDSGGTNLGKKLALTLPEERACRLHSFIRAEQEMLVISDPKHDRGPTCAGCYGGDCSPTQSTSSCTSSGYSGSSSEETGNSLTHDAEDDWEAVADAIYMQGSACKTADSQKSICIEKDISAEKQSKCVAASELQSGSLKPEYKYKAGMLGGRMRGMGGRAWRPDDAARPPTLPRLSKQHSFPLQSSAPSWSGVHGNNLWGPPPAPLYCPICTEELDVTDSSFVPCSCGFRLCLFCHHRIAAEDGRCPGCRKTYNTDVAMKLSRSSSVWLRV